MRAIGSLARDNTTLNVELRRTLESFPRFGHYNALMSAGHPKHIEDITAEWLTRALREGGVCREAHVASMDMTSIGGGGVGFLSGLARIKLTYDRPEPQAPASVVVKLPTSGNTREVGDTYRAYEREARFYRDIAPRSRVRAPRSYYSVLDVGAGDFILIMEDVSRCTKGDQVKGLTVEQATAAVDTIGAFHAQWWNHQELTQLTWMPFENLDIHHLFAQNWPEFRHQFYDELAREEIAVGDRLNRQGDRLAALVADVPRTIVHFDYRADNLMFDEQSRTEPVIVLDWQFVQRSMGAFDVARVVGGSVPSEHQAGRHREFVALWHDGLARAGVRGYGLEDAWRDFLKGLLLCLYIPVAFHHMAWPEGERARALVRAMFHRFFRTAVETDACRVLDR